MIIFAGMMVDLAMSAAQREAARLLASQDFHDRRDATILQKAHQADPEHDFLSLLSQTTRGERLHIRDLTMAKVRSHPDLNGALADVLVGGHSPTNVHVPGEQRANGS
jgi:hypothetical protein